MTWIQAVGHIKLHKSDVGGQNLSLSDLQSHVKDLELQMNDESKSRLLYQLHVQYLLL